MQARGKPPRSRGPSAKLSNATRVLVSDSDRDYKLEYLAIGLQKSVLALVKKL